MGVKEFWSNRSFGQKIFIKILLIFGVFYSIFYLSVLTGSQLLFKLVLPFYLIIALLMAFIEYIIILGFLCFLIWLFLKIKHISFKDFLNPIAIIIVIILSILFSNTMCTDSNDMCEGQSDGTQCETGRWCDIFGRTCGGGSCVGHGLGKCFQERCINTKEYFESVNVVSIKDCERIGGEYCYRWLAQKLNDSIICNEIENKRSKEWCIVESGAMSVEDCEKMEYWKSDCIIEFVDSIEVCEKMEQSKLECYHNLARNLNDINICDKIKGSYLWTQCVYKTAMSIDDCERLGYDWMCYYYLAQNLNDKSVCDKIEEENYRKECISQFQG